LLLKNLRGGQLDNPFKLIKILKLELKKEAVNIIIFIRDLDGLISESDKIVERNQWFQNIEQNLNTKANALFFLIIYELEALIFADISTFNKLYNTSLKENKNPLFIELPKEKLITVSYKKNKTDKESDAPNIFENLDYDTVYQNHEGKISFQKFIDELEKVL
jgi:hypothetical protein